MKTNFSLLMLFHLVFFSCNTKETENKCLKDGTYRYLDPAHNEFYFRISGHAYVEYRNDKVIGVCTITWQEDCAYYLVVQEDHDPQQQVEVGDTLFVKVNLQTNDTIYAEARLRNERFKANFYKAE